MKRLFSTCLFFCFAAVLQSQELSQITFSGGSSLSYFSLLSDREVLIRITDDGHIKEWGVEVRSIRVNDYYAPGLQPYIGRVEYYGSDADSVSKGKVRSIGSSVITYYGSYELPEKVGKIRSAGNLQFDYYSNYDNKAFRGKIKFIGNLLIDYYSTFDDEALTGKLKSAGYTTINYHTSFDDKLIRGKIKSIGSVNYTWYTSLDRTGFGGSLKSGPLRQYIAGITYIIM